MSSYKRLNVPELRELCRNFGLPSTGRKADLIAVLEKKDRSEMEASPIGPDNQHNEEVEEDGEGEETAIQVVEGETESAENDFTKLRALELKLQLARENREVARENRLALEIKERMLKNSSTVEGGATARTSFTVVERELRGLLPKMSDRDDEIISFFNAYERTLELYDVDDACYARLLPGCLSMKASKVYSKLSLEQSKQYALVKREILASFKLDAASYLQKFRTARRTGSESYKLFGNRLQELQTYYLDSKDIDSFDGLKCDMLLEQFISTLPAMIKSFVLARRPSNVGEASDFADLAFQVSQERDQYGKFRDKVDCKQSKFNDLLPNSQNKGIGATTALRQVNNGLKHTKTPIVCYECGGPHKKLQCPKLKEKTGGNGVTVIATCFTCGEKGHKSGSPLCRGKVGQPLRETYFVNKTGRKRENIFVIPTFVNGVQCEALRDTGASCTLIKWKAVKNRVKPIENRYITIEGVTGQQRIPVAEVMLYSPHFHYDKEVTVLVGLIDNMQYDVLLGNDIFDLGSELTDVVSVTHRLQTDDDSQRVNDRSRKLSVNAVQTRRQTTGEALNRSQNDSANNSLQTSCAVTTDAETAGNSTATGTVSGSIANDLNYESLMPTSRVATEAINTSMIDSASVSKDDTEPFTVNDGSDSINNESTVINNAHSDLNLPDGSTRKNISRTDFTQAQQRDASLKHLFDLANAGSEKYFIEDGILYRRAIGGCNPPEDKLLVVPSCYREQLVRTAHDSMWSAHSGARRTAQRIGALFFFPRMHSYITSWVKNCPVCQRIRPIKTKDRVPLNETPVINEVFADLTVDVCGGNWPITPRKNRYLLTAICNATKFAFAMAVPNLRAKTLAARLMKLFSSIGLPKTLRLDSAAQWRGSLMQELTRSLGIACNIATAFHHESIGTIERFNYTLERMAKSFIHENPTQWDIAIDYYLFAYNSVKSATTGCSPQELVYGRNLRSPLNVMREVWLNGEPEQPKLGKDVLTYLTELKEQLEAAAEAAEAETKKQNERQRNIYNRKTTVREFKEGDLVLVLQPTNSFKMLAQWAGPYPITRKLNSYNYELDLGNRKTILHINLLRKWEERIEVANVVTVNDDLVEGEEKILDSMELVNLPMMYNVGVHLTETEKAELFKLFADFPQVFTDKIGCTDLVQHVIRLTDSKPCVQPPYKVPEALRQEVQMEIERLLAEGIIAESDSNFCAPLVFVRRHGSGKLRICGDWRKLNQITEDDPYLMNNPAEILSRVSGAKFISTIDLNSAYYQVPLEENSRKYTAFRCFCGKFEFLRGGFGLKNMPKTFQKLVNKILRGCEEFAESHLDDICIYSKTFSEHVAHLREVLIRLRNAGLTANTSKCKFLLKSMKILGHVLEDGLIRPDEEKVAAIQQISTLATKTQVKSFLGLTGYYADFIPGYQEKAYALTELLKRNKPDKVQWREEEQKALDALKMALISKPVLVPPDPSLPFIIQSDASRRSISAILCQRGKDNKEHVISYASRKLLPRETKYSVIELELLAAVFGVTKFNHYVYGRKIELQSDHRPLSYIAALLEHSPRLARWNLILSNYDITPTYKRGSLNSNVDGLSRL